MVVAHLTLLTAGWLYSRTPIPGRVQEMLGSAQQESVHSDPASDNWLYQRNQTLGIGGAEHL